MARTSKYPVTLTDKERKALEAFVSSGEKKARQITRARILLYADADKKDIEIQSLLGITHQTILTFRKKYLAKDYDHILDVLQDAPRTGRPLEIDSRVEANISMIACSDPPEGSARWTLHMIADRVVKMEVIEKISHESVRSVLKKTD